ncbi:hypothetical protein GOP47_0010925 [Adiantum capillus-veneris]|uniref:Ty3 transposon capsid-like protein domain-containing protein n=1 Tax=Adiantum capillus-veneris TaxID=13818 RepID=A0A9D4ZGV4_ADICA|nr:hypothetical protein GOP47_0010925 [Adiantum capillus-veneris]
MKQEFGPVSKGDEDADDWLADFELFMLTVLRMPADEAKLQTLPLVLQGKAKVWFDGLEDVHKQTWIGFREQFLQRYRKVVSASEAGAKIKGLQQDVSANFDAFVDKFEAYWGDLVAATQATNAGYLKLERFLSCLHPYVRERVDYEDPSTYDEAIRIAKAKSRKMKKKMEAGLLQLAITIARGPKPKKIDEHQEVKDPFFVDMNVIKARKADARLEELDEVPTRAQQVQRGIFRVPPSLIPQESEVVKVFQEEVPVLEPETRLTAKVQELTSAEEEFDSSQRSSSSLDTDSMWETDSRSSRYETYDVFYVNEVENNVCELPVSHLEVEETHSAGVEMPCVNFSVEQPCQMSCDGDSLLKEEVWFDCVSDLIEEQVFENDLQELEAEIEVCRSDLYMQGVGQPCLCEHVEVCFEVSEFVDGRGELAPASDSMEADIGAAYEREAPWYEEGISNLAGDEVLVEHVVVLAGHVLEYEKGALVPFTKGWDIGLQWDQVCLAMQQVEAIGRVLLLHGMLLIAMLLQVTLQVFLCQWQGFFAEEYTMEDSLTGGRMDAYGTNASSVRKCAYGWQQDLWMQGDKSRCCKELLGWPVYWPTGTKEDLKIHALQVDGHDHGFVFDPSGLYAILGEASSFPFDPGG